MNHSKPSDQTFAGVFLIGLAVLFITHYWWPGIMFVIGIAMIARTIAEGRQWNANQNALIVLGIGAVFAIMDVVGSISIFSGGLLWPLILIGVGLYLLCGRTMCSQIGSHSRKAKHDDLL